MKKIMLLLTIALLFSAVSLYAQTAQTRLDNGKRLFDQNNRDGALQELNEAIKLDPNLAEAYAYRARIYNGKSDYDRALSDANRAIQLNSRLGLGYFARAYAYREKNDIDRAIADYTEAIRLDPKFAIAYNNRGAAYKDKGDYDRAIADYNEAIRLDPNYTLAKDNKRIAEQAKRDAAVASSGSSGTTVTAQEPASSFRYDLNKAGNGIVIKKYTGKNTRLVIPWTIEGYPVVEVRGEKSIPDYSTDSISNIDLVSVVIPEGVRYITNSAFAYQRELASVTLPSTLEEIDNNAFFHSGLRTIRIPDSVKRIGAYAFSGNFNLTDANIPSGIEFIGDMAFYNCRLLSNLTIPASIRSIDWGGNRFQWGFDTSVFRGCALTIAARRRLTELGHPADGF